MQKNHGFVYIWYDRKHKRYYIGAHWGTEDDGYICSSPWMKNAYKRRPSDFKRRIIESKIPDRKELLEREHIWLQKIRDEDVGVRYYNLSKRHFGHWSIDHDHRQSVGEKISNSPHRRENISKAHRGKKLTQEHRSKISAGRKGISTRKGYRHSQETLNKLRGRRMSNETKAHLSEINTGKKLSIETRAKMSNAKKGRKHSIETIEKIRISKQTRDQSKKGKLTCKSVWQNF